MGNTHKTKKTTKKKQGIFSLEQRRIALDPSSVVMYQCAIGDRMDPEWGKSSESSGFVSRI